MKKLKLYLLLIAMSVYLSCSSPSNSFLSSGEFAVERVSQQSAVEGLNRTVSIGTVTVDASESIFFIVKNIGDYPIRQITLEPTNIGDFSVTPSSIDEMGSDITSAISRLIRVDINHGSIYGKIGQYNYISPAVTGTTISISGLTSSDGSNYNNPVSVDVNLGTVIDLAEWDIQVDERSIRGTTFGYSNLPTYYQCTSHVVLVNTGNVPLTVSIGDLDFSSLRPPVALAPSAWIDVGTPPSDGMGKMILVDTLGTVFDNTLSSNTPDFQFTPGTSKILFYVSVNDE